MRDLIWVAIIIFWVVAVRLTRRIAFWEPRTVMVGGVAYLPDERPTGFWTGWLLSRSAPQLFLFGVAVHELTRVRRAT